jgi:two-component system, cell cycle sensor histidine kinase and response regulator CckA
MSHDPQDSDLRRELSSLREQVQQLSAQLTVAKRGDTRYQLLMDNLNVGVFVTSLDGIMLECNELVAQMAGEPSREGLLGRKMVSRYEDPSDRERMVQQLRDTGAVRNLEMWTVRSDGKRHCASMTAVLAPIGPQGEQQILGMLEDVTERKLAQERAGEGEERFRVIAEQAMLGIAIMQDSRLRFVNQAVSDINGYSVEEMSTWNVIDFSKLIHPDDLAFAADQARRKQAGETDTLPHYSYRMLTKSGEVRWVEQYSRSIEYEGRAANFITLIDVTARKQAEESLSQLAQSMERAAKLESLGVLAAGIAHDFNNLLSGLYGHLDLARESAAQAAQPAARSHLDLAHQSLDKAKALTAQLLAFAKGGAPVRTIGSVTSCVKQCADFALSGSNVTVELDLDATLWSAEFDGNQLSQAFGNLIINAKQSMPAGGTLRITGRNIELFHSAASVLKPGRYVKLSFADQGNGVAPGILERIFDPFFTTKAEGSGLGLTSTYAILKKHDGNVEVESKQGQGATFHVWLPAAIGKLETPPPPAARETLRGHGLVLVMDDDATVRRVAGNMLARLGYEPILTSDGAHALASVRQLLAEGKVLTAALLDLTIRSGQGGRDTVGPLRELLPRLPIVASSGYSDDPIMADPKKFCFTASLRKPFLLSELSSLLLEVIAESKAVN